MISGHYCLGCLDLHADTRFNCILFVFCVVKHAWLFVLGTVVAGISWWKRKKCDVKHMTNRAAKKQILTFVRKQQSLLRHVQLYSFFFKLFIRKDHDFLARVSVLVPASCHTFN